MAQVPLGEGFEGNIRDTPEYDYQYPDRKLSADDEGALNIGLAIIDNRVVLNFFKHIDWIGMDKATAETIGQAILDKAKELK